VRSAPLAAFFSRVLRSDMQLEIDASLAEGLALEVPPAPRFALEAPRPPRLPPELFPSRRYRPRRELRVVPVLSPDNYMAVIPNFLASARGSIYLEQQYMRADQPQVRRLLAAIASARQGNPRLKVRIVLARPIGSDLTKEKRNLQELESFGLQLGSHIRYLNPQYFVHCHNKLIVIDRQAVLVSSQNWSDFAVAHNREAGLVLHAPTLARYYAKIFGLDWETGLQSLEREIPLEMPAGLESAPIEMLPVSLGDYIEV
jgi:phosphatidylserine/phosphatidylglycerophosphate/cardiolipin synthase-like enzyme